MPFIRTKYRRGTTEDWEANTDPLLPSEIGIEVETINPDGTLVFKTDVDSGAEYPYAKIGDGIRDFHSLPYFIGPDGSGATSAALWELATTLQYSGSLLVRRGIKIYGIGS